MRLYYHEIQVTGRGPFPVDMLRYDHCFPADMASVMALVADAGEAWTARLGQYTSNAKPEFTPARWSSFLCGVNPHITTRKLT